MKKSRIIYAIILIGCIIFTQALYDSITLLTLAIVIIAPIISFLLFLMGKKNTTFKIVFNQRLKDRFQTFGIRITSKVHAPITLGVIKLNCILPTDDGNKAKEKSIILSCPPGKNIEFNENFILNYTGSYPLGIKSVVYYDLFKLFKFEKEINLFKDIFVNPRIIECKGINFDIRQLDASSGKSQFLTNNYNSEMNGVREYQTGDTLKNVHWKLSSRTDDLYVKQFSESIYENLFIFTDLFEYSDDKEQNNRLCDCVSEVALALARLASKSSVKCRFLWSGNGIFDEFLDAPEQFSNLYNLVAMARHSKNYPISLLLSSIEPGLLDGAEIYIVSSDFSENLKHSVENITLSTNCKINIIIISENSYMINSYFDLPQGKADVFSFTPDDVENNNINFSR